KLSRTFITVGGMAVGIGAIVLLESIGYGLQELVISRVARLEELKQVNVSPQQGNNIKITDESLASFKNLTEVFDTWPQI
ncbi:ABC transporter permease, partial [candidate division WWE3 bacterium]|nr:ABC transporter permease [candidate division WWE3 bacterium]